MSAPKLKPGSSRSERPTWFQDMKSGCEKQTDYFLRIRKLQKELINREQHNLVNAMERLKQLQYPRRKPFVRNFDVLPHHAVAKCFPSRPLHARRDWKHRFNQRTEDEEIKPLKAKSLLPNRDRGDGEDCMDPFTLDEIKRIYSMLPILNDKQIAKIVNDVRTTFPNEPSTYLLQPHLPSIPNVSRKANKRLDNRLRMLTLTESSCDIGSSCNVQQIHYPYPQRQRKTNVTPKDAVGKRKKNERRKGKKNLLSFDVDPNDSSVFANSSSACGKNNIEDEDGSPLPPPNSRPMSPCNNISGSSLDNEPSKGPIDLNVVEMSVSDNSIIEKEKVQELFKKELDKKNANKLLDEKDDHQGQSKPESRAKSEEIVKTLESDESTIEDKSENASVVCTEPVVKITRKASVVETRI